MGNLFKYGEFLGTVQYSAEDEIFFGKVLGIDDLVTFEGSSVRELKRAFKESVNDYVDEAVPEGITLKQIFDKFWEDVDGFGLSMDSGGDIIEEVIRDWMRDNNFLVSLEEDGWLDD